MLAGNNLNLDLFYTHPLFMAAHQWNKAFPADAVLLANITPHYCLLRMG